MAEPHRMPLRVYYEDTDSGGVVYYANYLKYAERGRTEFLRDLGFDHPRMLSEFGLGFVVRRVEADYLRSAVLDDMLTVETSLTGLGGARFEMAQRVLRNDTILCELAVTLGCVTGQGKPGRIPSVLRDALGQAVEEGKG